MRLQREAQALQQDATFSPGMLRQARATGRLLRSGMAAAAAVVASPMRQVQKNLFSTATPEKPSRPVPARESGVEAASVVEAAGAQEQRVVAEGEQQSVHAREGDDQAANAVDAAVTQESVVVQESTAQILQVLQQMRAEVRAEIQLVRKEVQQVRTEVRTEVEQRVRGIEEKQAQLQAQVMGVSASFAESASTGEQQLTIAQAGRVDAIEQQLQQIQQQRTIAQAGRVDAIEQQLQQIQHEQGKLKGNEERLCIVEQLLSKPGVDPGEHERQQRLEERQDIVEQQWRNRHARELEEQARLLQALRDEQERLRDEQEKIRNNEKSRERRAGKAAQRARARVGSELRKIRRYVGDAQWQHPRACLAVPRHV